MGPRTATSPPPTERPAATRQRMLGVTVLPMYLQAEGVDAVLDALAEAGVDAITTVPAVYEPIDRLPGTDDAGLGEELPRREPPIDGGAGDVRVVERRLWGRDAVLVRPAPSAPPDLELYRGLAHQPVGADALTASAGPIVARAIEGAHARGMSVHFQLSATQVPGRRDVDMPRMPDGTLPRGRLAETVSLASDDVRAYVCARARDVLRAYPDIDGLRHDWPEYPPYTLGDAFLDFSEPARRMAERLGYDFERMRRAAAGLLADLREIGDADLRPPAERAQRSAIIARMLRRDGIIEWLRFKAAVVTTFLCELRDAVRAMPGGVGTVLAPNAFPPPLSRLSGFDVRAAADVVDAVNVKLFTLHWPLIVRRYADELIERASAPLDVATVLAAISSLFDLEDGPAGTRLEDYDYPAPDVAPRAGVGAQRRKIGAAVRAAGGRAAIVPVVHGYGPLDDFEARMRLAWDAGEAGVWLNRYAYLGPAKLRAVGRLRG